MKVEYNRNCLILSALFFVSCKTMNKDSSSSMIKNVVQNLDQNEIKSIIDIHNDMRKSVNVKNIYWNNDLQLRAQEEISKTNEKCEYSKPDLPYGINYYENLIPTDSKMNFSKSSYATEYWINQVNYFSIDPIFCATGFKCENLTQFLWFDSDKIGCAKNICDLKDNRTKVSWLCLYEKKGNIANINPLTGSTTGEVSTEEREKFKIKNPSPILQSAQKTSWKKGFDDLQPVLWNFSEHKEYFNIKGPNKLYLDFWFLKQLDKTLQVLIKKFDVAGFTTSGAYNYRNIAGSSQQSQHSFGLAIDLHEFKTKDGTTYNVLKDWKDPVKGVFLKKIFREFCYRFANTLGPDYNAAHKDHFHVDLYAENKTYFESGLPPMWEDLKLDVKVSAGLVESEDIAYELPHPDIVGEKPQHVHESIFFKSKVSLGLADTSDSEEDEVYNNPILREKCEESEDNSLPPGFIFQ